jgi:ATP-binding cassette subfamily F protein 3
MIRLQQLQLARGGRVLLDKATVTVDVGHRAAILGANGCGKSTLFEAIMSGDAIEAGRIDVPASWRTVRLEQEPPSGTQAAWRRVFAADPDLDRLLSAIEAHASIDAADLDASQAELQSHWHDANGPAQIARAKQLLAGLGFAPGAIEGGLEALSGGWRMRVNLARALFAPSELLLLDEPTNHLDLEAIVWLERWLIRYPGTVLVISHDREFIDRVAQLSLAFEGTALVRYSGGVSQAEAARVQRLMEQQRHAARQASTAAHLERFIARFRAQATKARQVQSRIKALEKLQTTSQLIDRGASLDFELAAVGHAPDPLVQIEQAVLGYPEAPVLSNVTLQLRQGARLGILGRNGAGKSTLVRSLVGELPLISGDMFRASQLRVGYFAQDAIERLSPQDTAIQLLGRVLPKAREQELRDRLGRWGFAGELATTAVGPRSGGEKSRLVLCLIAALEPHLLVLDEPTNHLDAASRDALTQALAAFDGAVVLVSHDRHLLNACAETLVVVREGQVCAFEGSVQDYLDGTLAASSPEPAPSGEGRIEQEVGAGANRKAARREAAAQRQALAKATSHVDKALQTIERELQMMQAELNALDAQLTDPEVLGDSSKVSSLMRRRAQIAQDIETAENQWFALTEQREAIIGEASTAA